VQFYGKKSRLPAKSVHILNCDFFRAPTNHCSKVNEIRTGILPLLIYAACAINHQEKALFPDQNAFSQYPFSNPFKTS